MVFDGGSSSVTVCQTAEGFHLVNATSRSEALAHESNHLVENIYFNYSEASRVATVKYTVPALHSII